MMNNSSKPQIVEINWSDRWQIYNRLQALEIACICKSDRPLQVYYNNPYAAVRIWSVAKQFTAKRQESLDWLERCWQIDFDK
jgi:hypothetical protein